MDRGSNPPTYMSQGFCAVEKADPALHRQWLDKHGFQPDEQGRFLVDSFEGKDAVTRDQLFENIRKNVAGGYYVPLYTLPYDERVFVMVCGGPSLAEHLEELREKSRQPDKYCVVCSNMTGGYLLENGITPHAHFILDPQEKKKFDLLPHRVSKETQYWLNVACDPAVFDALKALDIKPHAFLADFDSAGTAIQAVKDALPPGQPGMMAIQGGTMAGLRAFNLADALGFRSMEYYGFDGSVKVSGDKVQPYAYEKRRGETIIEVTCDLCPATFDTTLIFQRQVNEFLEWRQNMPWLDVEIIGGGLISHSFEHLKERERAKEAKNAAYRFTLGYADLQRALHAEGNYGGAGREYVPTIFHAISQLVKRHGAVSVLDYGSAGGNTMKAVRGTLWVPDCVTDLCYDPFVDEYSAEPEPADLVLCNDVLEHVEPECTAAVLDHLQSLTKKIIFLSIALKSANKVLADGRNAHINLRTAEFWIKEIRRRFITSEARVDGDEGVLIVAQSIDGVRETLRRARVVS